MIRKNPPEGPPPVDVRHLERALRATFSESEWRLLQAQLIGALKAVQILRERAPEIAQRVWGRWAVNASPNELSQESREWIETIVAGLLEAQRTKGQLSLLEIIVRQRKPMLKAVVSPRRMLGKVK